MSRSNGEAWQRCVGAKVKRGEAAKHRGKEQNEKGTYKTPKAMVGQDLKAKGTLLEPMTMKNKKDVAIGERGCRC